MSYVIQAVLSNPRRPECDQITIPFPIPVDQYDKTIEMLQAIDLGFSVNRDCTVDEVNSRYSVLNTLVGTLVNIDQLDYLAKRLDGFCAGEVSQFQAMAHKLGLSEIKDFINLTYCCQQTTVITDFSDLEQIGKDHTMTLNGGAMPIDQYQAVNGKEAALQLINGGRGVITPYGVVYDNGMKLEPAYNGHQFPSYLYDHSLLVLEITPKRGLVEGSNPEYLYLPASEHQIERTLLRVGITTLHDAKIRIDWEQIAGVGRKRVDEHLAEICADISMRRRFVESPTVFGRLAGWWMRCFPLRSDAYRRFYVEDSCSGCGICARLCPVGNIVLLNGRPMIGEGCLICGACYHNCPSAAVRYNGEKSRVQYRHPGVSLVDIMSQSGSVEKE